MRALLAAMFVAMVLSAPAFAEEDDTQGLPGFKPGFQLGGFAMAGDKDNLTWGFGLQGSLFRFGQVSLLGPGISFHELNAHWAVSPFVSVATIDFSEGPGIIGLTFMFVFRNAFGSQSAPLDMGFGVGTVIGGP